VTTERVVAFVDGFNLYHSLHDLRKPHLKWVDLWSLMARYAAQPHQVLAGVRYFSAFATWRPGPYARHRAYAAALEAVGVTVVMGRFKEKDRQCRKCGTAWITHEEKETDVNVGLWMLNEAYKDTFDHAFLVSNDSDLSPVIRMLRQEFPKKRIRIITPPGRRSSKELVQAAGGMRYVRSIKESRVAAALLPASLVHPDGRTISRPTEYDPP